MATRMVLVGLIVLALGGLGTVSSILYQSTVLAFVGLTLILWGCLFTLVLPSRYVKSEIMDHMSSSSLSAIDQIIKDLPRKRYRDRSSAGAGVHKKTQGASSNASRLSSRRSSGDEV